MPESAPIGDRVVGIPDDMVDEVLTEMAQLQKELRSDLLVGVIIAEFVEGKPHRYYAGEETFPHFASPTCSEQPRIYKTRRILTTLCKLRTEFNGCFHAALWRHPDFYVRPNERYIDGLKRRFPGSPRR